MINKSMNIKAMIIFPCIFLGLLMSGCKDNTEQLPVYKVEGPVKVSYAYETSGGGTSRTDTPIEASEILMFEQYVIIKVKDGFTILIPINKIKSFIIR
jgi:hypothetical protein